MTAPAISAAGGGAGGATGAALLPPPLARLERWLEAMRVRPAAPPGPGGAAPIPEGYGGPVVHWWRDSLRYCGPAFDWRYEGIVHGYLTLFRRTGDRTWLEKARRAGDDLLGAQLPGGTFLRSRFEQNPGTAGTPHEFAVDLALTALAGALREAGDAQWSRYLEAALRNVESFCVGQLWDEAAQSFRDDPGQPSFVPNKACTLVEALFPLADLTGDAAWIERYALPTLRAVLRHQVRRGGDPLDGGIAQNSFGARVVEKYFPYYVARCVPALLAAHTRTGDAVFLDAAHAAGSFLRRWQDPDGSWPQVLYPGGRVNRYPRWIAGAADVYRVLDLLDGSGGAGASGAGAAAPGRAAGGQEWLLGGQLPSGAIRVASGFASQVSQRAVAPGDAPEARDLMPVAGWNDKAFRYLASTLPLDMDSGGGVTQGVPGEAPGELACTWRGRPAVYREDASGVTVTQDGAVRYRWRRGDAWAEA